MSEILSNLPGAAIASQRIRQFLQASALRVALLLVLVVLLVAIFLVGLAALAIALFMAFDVEFSAPAAAGWTAAVFLGTASLAVGLMWWRLRQVAGPVPPPPQTPPQNTDAAAAIHDMLDREIANASERIGRQPLQSVMTAAVLGIAAGLLASRKQK